MTLTLSKDQLYMFRGLQEMGSHLMFGSKTKRYREYSGYLVLNKKNQLEDVVVTTKITIADSKYYKVEDAGPPSPHHDLHAYFFHTHPGKRLEWLVVEPGHIGDVLFFAENLRMNSQHKAELIFAPEGVYIIKKLNPKYPVKEQELEKDQKKLQQREWQLVRNITNHLRPLKKKGDEMEYIFDEIVPLVKNFFLDSWNKIYKKYNIQMKFVPVEMNSEGVWFYPSFTS
jgi:hypothetical protein